MNARRLVMAAFALGAAVFIPAVVFAEDPAPKIESVISAADYKSVDVMFTVAPYTTRGADGTSASGPLTESDFTVTKGAGSVAFTVAQIPSSQNLGYRLTFTGGPVVPHDTDITLKAAEAYTAGGLAFPTETVDTPFTTADLEALVAGLKAMPFVPATGPDLPFVEDWFDSSQSLQTLVSGLDKVTVTGTEQQLIQSLKSLGATSSTSNDGYISAIRFTGADVSIDFNKNKVVSTPTFSAEGGADDINGKAYDISLTGDVKLNAALGGSLVLDVTSRPAVVDATSAPQLLLKSSSPFTAAGRLGVADIQAGAAFNLDAALNLTVACTTGPCTGIIGYEPTLTPTGKASLAVNTVDATFGSTTHTFKDPATTPGPLLELTWNDVSDVKTFTATKDLLSEVKLRDFTRVSAGEIAGGIQWIASWLTELEAKSDMAKSLPVVGGTLGEAAAMSGSLADPAVALAQIMGAAGELSAQDLTTVCTTSANGGFAAQVDAMQPAPDDPAAVKQALVDAGKMCQKLLKNVTYTPGTNELTYTVGFTVEEELFNKIVAPATAGADPQIRTGLFNTMAPNLDFGFGDLKGIKVTGRSGDWTGKATVTFNMTLGVKLGSASDLGIENGVTTTDFDGDGLLDAGTGADKDDDIDGDGLPEAHVLVAGDRCDSLAGLVGKSPDDLKKTVTGDGDTAKTKACDDLLEPGTVVAGKTLKPKDVCEAVSRRFGLAPDEFRTLNGFSGESATPDTCSEAVKATSTRTTALTWDTTKALGARAQVPHRLFVKADTEVATMALNVEGKNIAASATLGVLDMGITGTVDLDPKATFGFIDPATSGVKKDGKVDLYEFASNTDAQNLSKVASMGFSGPAEVHVTLANRVLFGANSKHLDVVGDLSAINNTGNVFEFRSTRVESATGLPKDILVVGHDLGDFKNLKDISPEQAIQMVQAALEQLAAIGGSGAMSQKIPFIDVTPADMVGFSADLADVAARVAARNPADITALEEALNAALGSVGMPTNVIKVGVTATALTVEFDASQRETRSYPFSLAGGGLSFAPADGGASVAATAGVTFKPVIGMNFAAGTTQTPIAMEDRLFVRNITPSFDVKVDAQVFGSVTLGPMSAAIEGKAKVGNDTAPAKLDVVLNGVDDNGQISVKNLIKALKTPSTALTLKPSGLVDGVLAVNTSAGSGTVNISGDLAAKPFELDVRNDFKFALALDLGTFVDGTVQTARFIGRSLEESEAVTSDLPLLGDELGELVTVGTDIRKGADTLDALWQEANATGANGNNKFLAEAEEELDAALCPSETDGCATLVLLPTGKTPATTFANAKGMELRLELNEELEQTVTLDEGMRMDPVFSMDMSINPKVKVGYDLDVVLGMDTTDGFYVKSGDGTDLLQLYASFNTDVGASVDLLGLKAQVDKGKASISGALGPDGKQGGFAISVGGTDGKLTLREMANRRTKVDALISPRFDVDVRADLPITVEAAKVASMKVPLHFGMSAKGLTLSEPTLTLGCDTDELPGFCTKDDRVELDVQSLVDNVMEPIFGKKLLGNEDYNPLANPDVKKTFDKKIDVLNTSLRELMRETAKATGQENQFKFVELLIDISNVDMGAASGKVDLGWAKVKPDWQYYEPDVAIKDQKTAMAPLYTIVDTFRTKTGSSQAPAASTQVATTSAASQAGTGTATPTVQPTRTKTPTSMRSMANMVSFPIVEDPAAMMNLLRGDVGESVDFVRIEAPKITIGPSINWSRTLFDLDIGFLKGGLTVAFAGNLGLTLELGVGFDSSGIPSGDAWKGLYIVDYPGPEVSLGGSVSGSIDGHFSVAGKLASVRFRGAAGVRLLAGIDLFDQSIALPAASRSDGRMTVGEIMLINDAYNNPLCMFELSVLFDAHLSFSGTGKLLGITVFDKSYGNTWTFVDKTLSCTLRPRVAHLEGRQLILNGGTFADFRFDGEGDLGEDFTITNDGAGKIKVELTTSGGAKPSQTFNVADFDEIYAELGKGTNAVRIHPDVDVPSTVVGGPGADTLLGGAKTDNLDGADGNDVVRGRGGADVLVGGNGNDTLEGGGATDDIDGGAGSNTYDFAADWGDDTIDDAGADATLNFTTTTPLKGEASYEEGTVTTGTNRLRFDLGTVTSILGGSGDDTFGFNRYAPEGFTFDGRGGSDTGTFQTSGVDRRVGMTDTGSAGSDKVVVLGTAARDTFLLRANATGTGPATAGFVALKAPTTPIAVERVDYDNSIENLNLQGLAGDNRYVLDDTATKLTLDSGDGNNNFQVGQIFAKPRTGTNVINNGGFRTRGVDGRGHLSYGVSHKAVINGGAGKDFFTVYSNTAALDLNGGEGDDTFVVRAFIAEGSVKASGGAGNDQFDYVQNELVTIDGGGGFNTFVAVGTEMSDGWHVTKDGLKICPLQDVTGKLVPRLPGNDGCGINVAYTNIQSLVAHGLNGNDVFWVQSTGTGVHTQLYGGTDGATFYVNNTATGVNAVDGPMTVRGDFDPNFDSSVTAPITLPGEDATRGTEPTIPTYDTQADKLVVDARPHTANDVGTLTEDRISGLGMGDGADTITVGVSGGSRSFPTGIVYEEIDTLATHLGAGADTFTIESTGTYPGTAGADDVLTNSTIYGGTGADSIRVKTIDGPTTVDGQAGIDTVRAGTNAPASNGRINAIGHLLTVLGGSEADALYIDDTAATGATTATITDKTVTGLGMPKGIAYSALETLDLDLGAGSDVLNLQGSAGSAATTVHGNTGDEDFYVSSAADLTALNRVDGLTAGRIETNLLAGNLDAVAGNVTLDAGAGNHMLMVSDRTGATGQTATMTANRISGLADGAITYNATGTYRRGITVWGSDHADTIAVNATRRDDTSRTSTVLNSGAGNDAVTVSLADMSNGSFVANLQDGADTLNASASTLGIMVFGGDGTDNITAGAGPDTVFGDLGTATYGTPTAGTVAGNGGTGDYTDGATTALSALTSRDFCTGGNDTINMGAGADVAYGGTGNDTLSGGAGVDTLLGDHGYHEADWLNEPKHRSLAATDAANCSGDDQILGGADADLLMGQAGADTIEGNTGNNLIIGGHDSGAGLDTGDVLVGGGNNDTIIGDNGAVSAANVVTVHDLGCDGTCRNVAGDDILRGTGGSDRLFGGVGDDYAVADGGPDALEGGPGNDWLESGPGDDDVIGGSSAPATVSPLTGYDSGDDVIFGTAGTDVILGDNGQIRRVTGTTTSGAEFIAPNPFTTSDAFLTANHRSVQSFDLADHAPSGADVISAGPDGSFIFGQGGDDWISGGGGDDYVEGNAGSDVVTGDRPLGLTHDAGVVSADLKALTVKDRPFPGVRASLLALRTADPVGATAWTAIEGSAGAAGQDDLVGGSSVAAQPNGDDIVYGDGADDVAYGDNAQITRSIITSSTDSRLKTTPYSGKTAPTYALHDERYAVNAQMPASATVVRDVVETDVGSSFMTAAGNGAPYGTDFVDGGAGSDVVAGQDGDDTLWGGSGGDGSNAWGDHVIGGIGADELFGGGGHDVLIGDRGSVISQYIDLTAADARDPAAFSYKSSGAPFASFDAFSSTSKLAKRDRHWNRVDLYCPVVRTTSTKGLSTPAFVGGATGCRAGGDEAGTGDSTVLAFSAASVGGADVARGGPGDDAVYGGGGNDLLNGDRGLDRIFGGVGDDALWGGMGHATDLADAGNNHIDLIFGGAGDDFLDYRPRVKREFAGQDGYAKPSIRHDSDSWFEATAPYAHPDTPDTMVESKPQHHQGVSWMYGGVGRDALQASMTSNGPNAGSRMLDWSGLYNHYTHCSSSYGGYNVLRTVNGSTTKFIQELAYVAGAAGDRTSGISVGLSGGDQVGYSARGETGSPYEDAHVGGVPGSNYSDFIECN